MRITALFIVIFALFTSPLSVYAIEEPTSEEESIIETLPLENEEYWVEEAKEELISEELDVSLQPSYPYSDSIKAKTENIFSDSIQTINLIQANSSSRLIMGDTEDKQIIVDRDLYIFEDTTLDRKTNVSFDEYSIYVIPKLFIALNQCNQLLDELNIIEEGLRLDWSSILTASSESSMDDMVDKLNEIKTKIQISLAPNQEWLAILDYLLSLKEEVPTLTLENMSINANNEVINLFNGAILDFKSGSVSGLTEDEERATITIHSYSKLINTSNSFNEVVHSDYNPTIIMNGVGSAISFTSTSEILYLNQITIHSTGAAFFNSSQPILIQSSVLMDNYYNYHTIFNKGSGMTIIDLCSVDDTIFTSSINNEYYVVKRLFEPISSQLNFHVTKENYDNYEDMIPKFLTYDTNIINNQDMIHIDEEIKKQIERTTQFNVEVSSFQASEDAYQGNVVKLNPTSYNDYTEIGLYGFEELYIYLIYDEPIYTSQLFESYYDKNEEGNKLIIYFKQHYFTDFDAYIYCESSKKETVIEDYDSSYYELYPNLINNGEAYYILDFELHDDDVIRVKTKNSRLAPIIEIPIGSTIKLPPPKPPRPGNEDIDETTGGGGRDESDRETNDDVPFPKAEEVISDETITFIPPKVEEVLVNKDEESVVFYEKQEQLKQDYIVTPIIKEEIKPVDKEKVIESIKNEEEIPSNASFVDNLLESVSAIIQGINQVIKVIYQTITNTIVSIFNAFLSIFQ